MEVVNRQKTQFSKTSPKFSSPQQVSLTVILPLARHLEPSFPIKGNIALESSRKRDACLCWWSLPQIKHEMWSSEKRNCSSISISIILGSLGMCQSHSSTGLLAYLRPIINASSCWKANPWCSFATLLQYTGRTHPLPFSTKLLASITQILSIWSSFRSFIKETSW